MMDSRLDQRNLTEVVQRSQDECIPSYEKQFTAFSDGIERILIRTSLVLALLLAVVQLLLLIPSVREAWVRTERLEGVPFSSAYESDAR